MDFRIGRRTTINGVELKMTQLSNEEFEIAEV
jgi:hypothetical protein